MLPGEWCAHRYKFRLCHQYLYVPYQLVWLPGSIGAPRILPVPSHWAFGEDAGQTSAGTYSTGAAHGDPMHGEDDTDPVEAAFKTLNPTIKL